MSTENDEKAKERRRKSISICQTLRRLLTSGRLFCALAVGLGV